MKCNATPAKSSAIRRPTASLWLRPARVWPVFAGRALSACRDPGHSAFHRIGARPIGVRSRGCRTSDGRNRLADRENLTLNRSTKARRRARHATASHDGKTNDRNFSAKVTSNSSWHGDDVFELQPSLGADYVNIETTAQAVGHGLAPGGAEVGQTEAVHGRHNDQFRRRTRPSACTYRSLASVRDRPVYHGGRAFGSEQRVRNELQRCSIRRRASLR